MTNTQQYTLIDEELARLASSASQELDSRNVPHAIVGNVAVQAYFLSLMSRKEGKSLPELAKCENLSTHLRPTNRIDIAVDLSSEGLANFARGKLIGIENRLAQCVFDFDENALLDYKLSRAGAKRVTFDLHEMDGSVRPIMLKFLYGPEDMNGFGEKFYRDSVDEVKNISLSYGKDRALPLKVIAPKYLLAAKIDRLEPQDLMDIASLAYATNRFGKGVNQAELRALLGEQYKANFETVERLLDIGKNPQKS